MESFKFIFRFVLFHRQIFLGGLILIGLAYFLIVVIPQLNNPNARRTVDQSVDAASNAGPTTIPVDSDLEKLVKPDSLETSSDSATNFNASESKPESKSESAPTGGVAILLQTGSLRELIEESLRIKSVWNNSSEAVAYLYLSDGKKIAERMLEMNLSDSQNAFAKLNLIESLSIRDSINISSKMNLNTRDEMMAIVEPFLNDPDSSVSSFANLAMVIAKAADFENDPSLEKRQQLESTIAASFDQISKFPKHHLKLAEVVAKICDSDTMSEQGRAFVDRMLPVFKKDTSETGKMIYGLLYEKSVFGPLELEGLVDRMGRHEFEIPLDVTKLFDKLAAFPEASAGVYQVSLDVVRELIRQDEKTRASELLDRLEQQILPTRTEEKHKPEILAAANELRSFCND